MAEEGGAWMLVALVVAIVGVALAVFFKSRSLKPVGRCLVPRPSGPQRCCRFARLVGLPFVDAPSESTRPFIVLICLRRRTACCGFQRCGGIAVAKREDEEPVEPRKKGARQRGMARVRNRAQNLAADEEGPEDEDSLVLPEGKIGTKKLRKLQEKEEKRRLREQMEAERADAKERQRLRDIEIEQEKEEERKKDEEKKRLEQEALEEKKRKEEEEYQAMKAMFVSEDAGSVEDEIAKESQGLLGEFVDYIKRKKVVLLEELGTEFNIKTAAAIQRLHDLEQMGWISGVTDDRGKFIYVSDEVRENTSRACLRGVVPSWSNISPPRLPLLPLLPLAYHHPLASNCSTLPAHYRVLGRCLGPSPGNEGRGQVYPPTWTREYRRDRREQREARETSGGGNACSSQWLSSSRVWRRGGWVGGGACGQCCN